MEMFPCYHINKGFILSYIFAVCIASSAFSSNNAKPVDKVASDIIILSSCNPASDASIFNGSAAHDGWASPKMGFDHQGNLWTGFLIKTPNLLNRSDNIGIIQYEVARIAKNSSRCTVEATMPSMESSAHAVMVSAKDRIIVVSNNEIHLFNEDAKEELATVKILGRSQTGGHYHVYEPFDGNDIVVVSRQEPLGKDRIEWRQSDSLALKTSCAVPYSHDFLEDLFSFSHLGNWIGEEDNVETSAGPHTLLIAQVAYCKKIQQIYQGLESPESASLLGDFIVLTYRDGGVSVRTLEGKSILVYPPKKHVEPAPWTIPIMSQDGSRIGIVMERTAGGSKMLDLSSHTVSRWIEVYDTSTWKMTSKIEVSPKTWDVNFCFSPDGGMLAVEADNIITIHGNIP